MTSTSDSARVEQALRTAFHDVTRDVWPKPGTGQLIEKRLRRRRRGLVAASLVAAAAVVAAALIVVRTSQDAGPSVLTPVEPRPAAVVLDDVDGVKVTWLPGGVHRTSTETRRIGNRTFVYSIYHLGPAGNSGSPVYDQGLPTFYVIATRDAPLAPLASDLRLNYFSGTLLQSPSRLSATTVHGRPAQLVRHGTIGPQVSYDLSWRENGVSVVVTGETRATESQVTRLAASTVVGPRTTVPAPAGLRSTDLAIRYAVTQALASTTVDQAVVALQDGPALRATVDKVIQHNPVLGGTVEITGFDAVTMLNRREAEVGAVLRVKLKQGNGYQVQEWPERVRAVLTPAGWKVTRDSYCGLVRYLGVACAPR